MQEKKANGLLLQSGSARGTAPRPSGAGRARSMGRGSCISAVPLAQRSTPHRFPKAAACDGQPHLCPAPLSTQSPSSISPGRALCPGLAACGEAARARGDAQPPTPHTGSQDRGGMCPGQPNPTSQWSRLLSEGHRWLPASVAAGGSPLACLGPPPQLAPRCQPPILAESGWRRSHPWKIHP